MNRAKLDEIITVVSRVLAPSGFDCIEAEWLGNERILRLYVDRLGGDRAESSGEAEPLPQPGQPGIDLEGCVSASRLLMDLETLDALIPGQYTLEVSSPGIERPLRWRDHFERHIGETVQVKLSDKFMERRQGKGRLVEVSSAGDGSGDQQDTKITLETPQGPWSFPLASLQRASLVYDWNGSGQ